MRHRRLPFLIFAWGLVAALPGLVAPASAEDGYRHGRIFEIETGVTLQRATEAGAEEAVVNLPLLPGDRVWTDGTGRTDFQFPDGTRLRLDSRSKLDYTAHDEGRGERIVLRLWSGGVYLHVRGEREVADYEMETPGGLVEIRAEGVYRVDADSGETRLTVYEGEATLDSGGGRRVKTAAGERTYARRGESPERPRKFDEDEDDDFARWDRDHEQRDAWADGSRRYLPDELDAYAPELESHGSWYYESEVGYVWRPVVAAGWRPYSNGRWIWTAYGWTWVPGESWGWAPSHYGRWGQSAALGWYWIPGNTWGPAWVSWASGGDYVGWCALGHHDRPVIETRRGNAVPRSSFGSGFGSAWSFVRRDDLAARDLTRRRFEVTPEAALAVRVADSPRFRPTRDARELREGGDVAVPRNIRVKPTPGDSVPELQRDNMTTVGVGPGSRRPHGRAPLPGDPPYYSERESPESSRGAAVARPVHDPAPGQPAREAGAGARAADPAAAHPTDVRSPVHSRPVVGEPAARERTEDRPAGGRVNGAGDPERDVLRRMFQPLSEPRSPRSGEEARPRDEGRSRDEARPRQDDGRSRDEGRSRSRDDGGAARTRESSPRESSPPPNREPRSAAPAQAAPPSHSAPPSHVSPPPAHNSPPPPSSGGATARPHKKD
jgi:hypothetical protein